MSFFDILTAAKPAFGTPPFAPPHPQSGGANIPTTAEMLPVKHGFAGFLDRALNPTNALGQFGQALLAGGGDPGRAMQLMMAQHQQRQHGQDEETQYQRHRADSFNDWQQREQWQLEHKQPEKTDTQRNLEALGIDPSSPQGQAYIQLDAQRHLDPAYQSTGFDAEGRPIMRVMRSSDLYGISPSGPQSGTVGAAPSAPGALAPTANQFGSLFNSLKNVESGNRPGILGPQTRYGQPQGETQMLPATARAMAQKLGVPWQPELMTSAQPEGAQYQDQLGGAYLQEGLDKYGGDQRKAAMYYHGGPNERLWGPKTRAYADKVVGGAQRQPSAGNSSAIIQQAQEAIAKGADPVKVQARLAQMGISL